MISEIIFKNQKAVQLENDVLRVIIIPSIGGKAVSIFRKDKCFELLFQNKEKEYRKPNIYSDFGEYDAAGFDDAFPTINECKVLYEEKEVTYPDHGEIWSADFNYSIDNERLILTYKSVILKYNYKKIFHIEGDKLITEYEIENYGQKKFPCIWTLHCLISCEEDMEIIFPSGVEKVINVTDSNYLGEFGSIHSYPVTTDKDGKEFYLDKVLPVSSKNSEKYYVKGILEEGFCGTKYPSKDIVFRLHFDKEKLPYLGFWVTEGGFRGDYNCALEPSNGYFDNIDIAKKENKLMYLMPGHKFSFSISMEVI